MSFHFACVTSPLTWPVFPSYWIMSPVRNPPSGGLKVGLPGQLPALPALAGFHLSLTYHCLIIICETIWGEIRGGHLEENCGAFTHRGYPVHLFYGTRWAEWFSWLTITLGLCTFGKKGGVQCTCFQMRVQLQISFKLALSHVANGFKSTYLPREVPFNITNRPTCNPQL